MSDAQSIWTSWLHWLIGFDPRVIPADANVEFLWTSLPASWGVFPAIASVFAVAYAVWFLYRGENDACPKPTKKWLAALRITVVVLLCLLLAGPSWITIQTRSLPTSVAILRDGSRSMQTADSVDGPSSPLSERSDALTRGLIQRLNQRAAPPAVHLFDFADAAKLVAFGDADSIPSTSIDGRGTDLSQAIETALAVERAVAIVLISDGQHTASRDARPLAKLAGQRNVPVFTVGIGDPEPRKFVRVARVYTRPQVWQSEPFEIETVIASNLPAGTPLTATLLEMPVLGGVPGQATGIAEQSFAINEGGTVRGSFTTSSDRAGQFVYQIRINPGFRDSNPDDDTADSNVVNVLDRETIRVLMVAGSASWDQRMVEKLLTRDPTVSLSSWLQSIRGDRRQGGDEPLDELPATPDTLFAYDVILLLDPNPNGWEPGWLELLNQFVSEQGGGLMWQAGPRWSGELVRDATFRALLPVEVPDDLTALPLAATGRREWPMGFVDANVDHPLIGFRQDRAETQAAWQALPGVFWSFAARRNRPGSRALIEHTDPALRSVEGTQPLLTVGRFGAGRTAYLGFNSTWRWRRFDRARLFDQFWIQMVRYLVQGRSLAGRDRGYVETNHSQYETGDRVQITARLRNPDFTPYDAAELPAELSHATASEPIALKQTDAGRGTFESVVTARHLGVNVVKITVPDREPPETLETRFTVAAPVIESTRLWLDAALLRDVADASGGEYLHQTESDQLAALIPERVEKTVIRSQPEPLWDSPLTLLLVVGLLCTEWIVRKRFNLV